MSSDTIRKCSTGCGADVADSDVDECLDCYCALNDVNVEEAKAENENLLWELANTPYWEILRDALKGKS